MAVTKAATIARHLNATTLCEADKRLLHLAFLECLGGAAVAGEAAGIGPKPPKPAGWVVVHDSGAGPAWLAWERNAEECARGSASDDDAVVRPFWFDAAPSGSVSESLPGVAWEAARAGEEAERLRGERDAARAELEAVKAGRDALAEERDALAQRVAELEAERLRALKIGYQRTQDCQSLPEMAQALVDAIGRVSKQVDKELAGAVTAREHRDALAAEVARLQRVADGARQAWTDVSTRCSAAEAEVARLRADIELFQRGASQAEQTRRDLADEVALLREAHPGRVRAWMGAVARLRERVAEGHSSECHHRHDQEHPCSCGHDL
ncbi:MAG: hypothetical protein ACRC4O_06705, partial [Giesbergeria sp.]